MKIWLNGALLDAAEARIDPADRGLLLGDGVFETVCIGRGRPLHLARHLARLRAGAATLGFAVPAEDVEIEAAALAVCGAFEAGALRITLSRGPARRGVLPPNSPSPTLLITGAAFVAPASPARAIVATVTRRNEHSPLARIKSLNYLDSVLARQEAEAAGAEEAILLNTAGRIAEASAGNLFVCLSGQWVTPPIEDGALPGIARALILEARLASALPLWPDDLSSVSSAFVSSSLGLRPLSQLGPQPLTTCSLFQFTAAVEA